MPKLFQIDTLKEQFSLKRASYGLKERLNCLDNIFDAADPAMEKIKSFTDWARHLFNWPSIDEAANDADDDDVVELSCYDPNVCVAVKIFFNRDLPTEELHLSYLAPVSFLATLLVGGERDEENFPYFNEETLLDYNFALTLYPYSSRFPEISGLGVNTLTPTPEELDEDKPFLRAAMLNFLSSVSLLDNEGVAKSFLKQIMLETIEDMKPWIGRNFPNEGPTFEFLNTVLNEAGVELGTFKTSKTRVLYTSYLHSFPAVNDVTIEATVLIFKDDVDVYSETDFLMTVYGTETTKPTWNVEPCEPGLHFIVPNNTEFTGKIKKVLYDWEMGIDKTPEIDRLARLIILVDKVTIIRHYE